MGVSGGGRLVWSTSSHCQLRQIPSEGGRRGRARGWAWHEVHTALPPRGQARQLRTPAAAQCPAGVRQRAGRQPRVSVPPGVVHRPGAAPSEPWSGSQTWRPLVRRCCTALCWAPISVAPGDCSEQQAKQPEGGGQPWGAVPAAPPFTSGTRAGQQPPNLHGLLPHFRVVIQDSAPESDTPVPWIPHACGGADTDSAPITHSRAELDCAPWTSCWSTGCAAALRCWPTSDARPAPSRSCPSPSQ